MKIRIGVFFGGKSVEHEVSIISAIQMMENLNEDEYDIVPVYISKDNKFYTSKYLRNIKEYKDIDALKNKSQEVYFTCDDDTLVVNKKNGIMKKELARIDVVFPVVHGVNVEDGTLQGFLEMYNIPYVGSDTCASAVGMNKIIFKKVMVASNIPVIEYETLSAKEFEDDADKAYDKIMRTLTLPIIAKPANLGSSVGIEVIRSKDEFNKKMQNVFEFCEDVLIERCVENMKEINCSVIGNVSEQETSVLEEPIKADEILSYKDKYMNGAKSSKSSSNSGMASLSRKIPAEITKSQEQEVYELAIKTFKALNCEGVVRVDFIIDNDTQKVYVNEINTIPGSLSYYLWEPKGLYYNKLLDKVIRYALIRKERKNKITYSTDVNILNMTSKK